MISLQIIPNGKIERFETGKGERKGIDYEITGIETLSSKIQIAVMEQLYQPRCRLQLSTFLCKYPHTIYIEAQKFCHNHVVKLMQIFRKLYPLELNERFRKRIDRDFSILSAPLPPFPPLMPVNCSRFLYTQVEPTVQSTLDKFSCKHAKSIGGRKIINFCVVKEEELSQLHKWSEYLEEGPLKKKYQDYLGKLSKYQREREEYLENFGDPYDMLTEVNPKYVRLKKRFAEARKKLQMNLYVEDSELIFGRHQTVFVELVPEGSDADS